MTNSTSEREQRQTDDDLARTVLRPVRGCATDNQYCDALDRALTAFSTIRQEERRAVWDAAIMLIKDRFGDAANTRVVDVVATLQDAYVEAAANETREDAGDAS